MGAAVRTPGVYRTTPAPLPAPLTLVRTDIAAFVGYAERGPLPEDYPPDFAAETVVRRLTSWAEFGAVFGGFLAEGYLAYAVRGFFETGGDTCYVLRVAATRAPIDRQPLAARFALPAGPAAATGTLALAGTGFTANLTQAPVLSAGQLVGSILRISQSGREQQVSVIAVQPNGAFLLAAPLDPGFTVGAAVEIHASGAAIVARSRGSWGNQLRVDFLALDADAFGLTVTVDLGPGVPPMEREVYPRLTPETAADTFKASSNLIDFTGVGKLWFDKTGPLGARGGYLTGGRDGLADVTLADFSGASADRRGLRLLEEIDEIAIIAIPDAVLTLAPPLQAPRPAPEHCAPPSQPSAPLVPPDPTATPRPLSEDDGVTLQTLMIEQCERLNYRVALIDPPNPFPKGLSPKDMIGWPMQQGLINRSARFAALYYPWLDVPAPIGLSVQTRRIPPSGYVAGAYAHVDRSQGVQQPPANVALPSVTDVGWALTASESGALNEAGVNAIRVLPGRGIRVWGARSLSPDSHWRFIHIRRLISAIEETLQRSSRWAVFERNDASLRSALTHSLTVLLEGIWEKGGLKGSVPAEGFYVRCDETNNPAAVVDAGQLVCRVGVAVAAPMEFLVFDIRQDVAGGSVVEA